jgi:hypothetical protein
MKDQCRNAEMPRGITIQDFKGGTPQGGMPAGVVPKLCQRKPVVPLGRAGMSKATEKGFHALINAFSLVVRLRMIGRTHAKRYTNQDE